LPGGGVEDWLGARRVVDDLAVDEVADGVGDGFFVIHIQLQPVSKRSRESDAKFRQRNLLTCVYQ
jgi:hypothetical protein